MTAQILTIGDELLNGQIINTNASFIAEQLIAIGIAVKRILTVGDYESEIETALNESMREFDLTVITGGLGPTHDDVTRTAICNVFSAKLLKDESVLRHVTTLMKNRNITMSPEAEGQALVPEGATVLPNERGTAPGLLLEKNGKYVVVMPGVPYEMEAIMVNHVVPRFSGKSEIAIIQKTFRTTGISESTLARNMGNLDELLEGARLAFLPSPTGVRMRVTVTDPDKAVAERKLQAIESRIRSKAEEYIYGIDSDELEEVLGKMLTDRGMKLAVAESCTGGLIANRITNVSGSSAYFERGVVCYSNESKIGILHVNPATIEKSGAVSKETAIEMAEGIRKISNADIGVSTTGIAGPTGGSADKPVGLVWIGYADAHGSMAVNFHFGDDRLRVKERAAQAALELVRRKLLKID